MDNNTALLAFTAVEGLGPVSIRKLLSLFDSPASVWEADTKELIEKGVPERTAYAIKTVNCEEFVDKQYTAAQKTGARIIYEADDDYPLPLKELPDAPLVLFVQGKLLPTGMFPGIAIIGTRKPTEYGHRVASRVAAELVEEEISIISGYAVGIDAAAHKSAAAAGGVTVAVLGCGLDYDYPVHNKTLRPRIIENGALVTEFPFGKEPVPWHFPRRNRIVSGLSRAVVVVEAGEKSGALITAKAALEQGKDVFAVPGEIDSAASVGTNRLIRDGAHPLLQSSDLLLFWHKREKAVTRTPIQIEIPLVKEEAAILDFIGSKPVHIDSLSAAANMVTSSIMPLLLSLEMKGMILRHPGMCFSR